MSTTKLFTFFSPFIYYALFLFIIGIFVFYKTFHLSLFGDEWQMLWIVKNSIATTGQWDSNIDQLRWGGYRFGALIMYLLTEYFGYDGKAVYIFSFLTRFFAALTLFYFLRKRDCSSIVAFLGALLFLITPIGLQATDWAKNFTSYISIIFFLLCITYIYNLKSWKRVLFFLLTFSISMYVNPIRSHGIFLTTTFLLVFQYFFGRSVNKKNIIFSFFCSLTIFFLILRMVVPGEITLGPIESLFGSIGAALLPQPHSYYLILLVAILLLWKKYLLTKKYLLFTLILHTLIIPIFLGPFLQFSTDKMRVILGLYFILFMLSTFIIELLNQKISEALNTALPFLLIICFLIGPWLVGTPIIDPIHRYFIYSALTLPIIVAFSLNQNTLKDSEKNPFSLFKPNPISFFVTLLLLIMFYLSFKSEINILYFQHNQDTARILWQQITPYFDNHDFKNHGAVVFFDTNNGAIVHDVVTFGFGFHMGYIYKIWVDDLNEMYIKLPIVVDSLADFNSMITDGKATKKYAGEYSKPFIFPKEDAFYFKIDNLKVTRIENL